MKYFRRLFGINKHQNDAKEVTLAISSCNDAISKLNRQECYMQSQMTIAESEARTLIRLGDRLGAEHALKKRELISREAENIHRTRISLISQSLMVETAHMRNIALEALSTGVAAHKKLSNRLFSEVRYEQLQTDLQSQLLFENDVTTTLEQGYGALLKFDDDDIDDLKDLLKNIEDEEIEKVVDQYSPRTHIAIESLCSPVNELAVQEATEAPLKLRLRVGSVNDSVTM